MKTSICCFRATSVVLFFFFSYFLFSQNLFDYHDTGVTESPAGTYRLTRAINGQRGVMTSIFAIDLREPFELSFELNFGTKNSSGADGIAFMFYSDCQNDFEHGGSLAIQNIEPSLFFEYDTYQNGERGDIFNDHMALMKNGSTVHSQGINPSNIIDLKNIEDGRFHEVTVKWTPNASTQTFSTTFKGSDGTLYTLSETENFINTIFNNNPIVFWGFTSSTGALNNLHQVRLENNFETEKYICPNETITLEAPDKGSNYNWTSNPSSTIQNNNRNIVTVSPSETTTYTCNYTDFCNENKSIQYIIHVFESSTSHVNPTCDTKGSITLSAKEGQIPYTYTLKDSSGNTIGSFTNNNSSHIFTNLDPGTYTYTVKDSGSCSETTNTIFLENDCCEKPEAPEREKTLYTICDGETLPIIKITNKSDLDNEGATIKWYLNNSTPPELVTTATGNDQLQVLNDHFIDTTSNNQIANYLVYSEKVCTDGTIKISDGVPIAVIKYALPSISIVQNPSCNADRTSYNFTVTSEQSNTITSNNTGATITNNNNGTWDINVNNLNDITLNIKNDNNCSISQNIEAPDSCPCATVDKPQVNGNNFEYCPGQDIPSIQVKDSYNPQGVTFEWFNASDDSSINSGKVLNLPTSITQGEFYVIATHTESNCSSEKTTVKLSRNDLPTLTISSNPTCNTNRTSYNFTVTSEQNNTITSNNTGVTITNNNNGTWDINVSNLNDITLNIKNDNCAISQNIEAPDSCPCATVDKPQVNDNNFEYCQGENIPSIKVKDSYNPQGVTFEWFNASDDSSINSGKVLNLPTSITQGEFYVIATHTESNCSSEKTTVKLSRNDLPTLTISSNPTCNTNRTSYNFTVTSEQNNTITSNNTGVTITNNNNGTWDINVSNLNDITLNIKNDNNCSISQNIQAPDSCPCATVDKPQVNGNNFEYCQGENIPSIKVKDSYNPQGVTFQWFNASDDSSINSGKVLNLPTSITQGEFYVIATHTESNCSSEKTTVKLSRNALPTIEVTSSLVCSENRKTYSFSIITENNITITSNVTEAIIENKGSGIWDITVPTNQDILLTAKNNDTSCSFQKEIKGIDCPCPTIEKPILEKETFEYCFGDPIPDITLESISNIIYIWYDENLNEIGRNIQSLPSQYKSGTFYIEAYNTLNECVSDKTTFTLIEIPLPEITLISSDQIEYCSGEDILPIEIESNADELTWFLNGRLISFKGKKYEDVVPGTYTVKASNSSSLTEISCEKQVTIEVIENPLPTLSSNGNQNYCTGNAIPTLSVSSNADQISWYSDSDLTQLIHSGEEFSDAVPGTYYVRAKDTSLSCESEIVTISLTENPLPELILNSNYQYLFYGQELELYSNIDSESTIEWSGPNGFYSEIDSPTLHINRPEQEGIYSAFTTDSNTCSNQNQLEIYTFIDVETAIGNDILLCYDETAHISYPYYDFFEYSWEGPNGFTSSNFEIEPQEEGTYTLTVTAPDGNQSIGSIELQITDLGLQEATSCLNQVFIQPTGGTKPYEFSLDGITWQSSPLFFNVSQGNYQVHIRDANQCSITSNNHYIKEFKVYQAFSPNGDGINDTWDLTDLKDCPNIQVKIFDRFGRFLHQMNQNNLIWDGRSKGKPLPSNTYWFAIDFNDGITSTIKSHITIKRKKD